MKAGFDYSRGDVVQAHYWFYADHHGGQWSTEYARLCKISQYYRPGRLEHGPDTVPARLIYDALCEKHGYPVRYAEEGDDL
jgi:hypothetical protein